MRWDSAGPASATISDREIRSPLTASRLYVAIYIHVPDGAHTHIYIHHIYIYISWHVYICNPVTDTECPVRGGG